MPVFQLLRSPLLISVAALVVLALVVVRSRRALLRPLPLALLLVGWPLGIWMFVAGDREETAASAADLATATGAAQAAIQQRLTTYVDALRSGASFMLSSPSISRERWATFAQTLDLPGRYPGANGIGVIYPVLPGDTDAFLRATRADGASDFTIRPVPGKVSAADRERFIITFISPLAGNEPAVGLDVTSEAARREAAERARDTGEPQLTSRITLVQDGRQRPGFLLYVPVYRVGAPLTTAAERRVALRAWIYAPFVTERLLQAVLGVRTDALHLHFFENGRADMARLLYATAGSDADSPKFALTTELTLAGQRFTLGWNRGPGYPARHQSPLSWIAVILALVTPLLVGMAVREETALAAEAGERRYRTLVEWSPEPSYVVRDGTMIYANPAAAKLFGAASGRELAGSSIFDRVHPDSHELLRLRFRGTADSADSAPLAEMQLLALDGAVLDVEFQSTSIAFEGAPAIHVTLRDVTARKRADRALRESEALFRMMADSAPVLIWMSGLDKGCFYFNRVWLEFTGRSVAQERGNGWTEGVHPDDLSRCLEIYVSSFEARQQFSMEYRLRRSDGEYRWLIDVGVPRFDDSGLFLGYIGSCIDLTERRSAEAAQVLLAARLQMLLDTASDGVHILGADGNLVQYSESFIRMLGYTDEEAAHLNVRDWDSHFHPTELLGEVRALIEKPAMFETRHRRKDGSIIDVEINAKGVELDGVQYLYASSRDISQRKMNEVALATTSQRLLSVIEGTTDAVAMVDRDYRYVLFNSAFRGEFQRGIGKDLTPGDSMREALAHLPDELASAMQLWNRCLDGEDFVEVRQFGDPGLARAWYELRLSPIRDSEGKVTGGVLILHDITERMKAEADRERFEAQQAYQRKAESLGRMAGAIAHIFNNQLQIVIGNLELAAASPLQGAATAESLQDAMEAARKAADVSVRLVTYLAQTHSERERLDLCDACVPSLSLLRVTLPSRVALQVDLPSPGPEINANAGQIEQVVTNLMTNAWEASGDEPGAIHLAVTRASLADIPVEHRFPVEWQPEALWYARLMVADGGGGIAADDIAKVFDPFYSTKFTGRGLGLPVALGIVREHGGVMTVKSAPGAGSVFSVFLPMVAPPVDSAALDAPDREEPQFVLTA